MSRTSRTNWVGVAMNKIQERMFQLLIELDEICKTHDIPYYLHSTTARMAYCSGGFEENIMSLAIEMTVEASQKLVEVIKTSPRENRLLEYMENSPNLHVYAMRYIDTETSYFPMKTYGNYIEDGIGVYIWIMRKWQSNRLMRRVVYASEVGWELNASYSPKKLKLSHRIMKMTMAVIIALFGRQRVSSFLYRFWNKNYAAAGNDMCIRTVKSPYKHYSQKFFSSTSLLYFEGKCFPGVGSIKQYLKLCQGKNWAKRYGVGLKPTLGEILVNTDINYQKVQLRLHQDGIDMNALTKEIFQVQKQLLARKKYFLRKKRNFSLGLMVGDDFLARDFYRENKEYIQTLYENYEFSALRSILRRYHLMMVRNVRRGRVVILDEEIFSIYLCILCLYDKAEFADKLQKLPQRKW